MKKIERSEVREITTYYCFCPYCSEITEFDEMSSEIECEDCEEVFKIE